MATDVARVSYDPARVYRGVALQQGRVSLEAEANEQRAIVGEDDRAKVIDIVGPVGTPDDGYAVSGSTGDVELTIGAGTMYVGGWRVELPSALGDARQPDWLDRPAEQRERGREHVLLEVIETDVTAVEDPALYEVALGGPDGSARTRLLQRIVRRETDGSTCAEAIAQDATAWLRSGLVYDQATAALESQSRLLVGWEEDPTPPSLCEPSAVGGYLGAENQAIRVQLAAVNRDGTFDLLWGYDDAAQLYRVTADASADPVLTLERRPVDEFHNPRVGQAVQALRSTAELASTDGAVEGYVAALGGVVGVLAESYDPDTKSVAFPAPLPAEYLDPAENPQLYLRVWEGLISGASVGTPIPLPGTGMIVTISAAGQKRRPGELHVDDFWCIGVRPETPTTVYPERYLRTPQPPDGPRMWVCPLAVIEWEKEAPAVLEDCRLHFVPLTAIECGSGCCTVEVRPSDAASGRLQKLIDAATANRDAAERGARVTVCFAAGRYELQAPIVLGAEHSGLVFAGCSNGSVLAVQAGSEDAFGHGMVIAVEADNVTLRGLEFELPQVPAASAKVTGVSGGVFDRPAVAAINAERQGLWVSIGVRAVNCAVLTVTECLFRFTVGPHAMSAADAQSMPRNVFGAGVFQSGGAWGARVRDSRFLHDPLPAIADNGAIRVLVGYLHAAAAAGTAVGGGRVGSARLASVADDVLIDDNRFGGLTAAVATVAELGAVRAQGNAVRDCWAGILLLDTALLLSQDAVDAAKATGNAKAALTLAALSPYPLLQRLVVLAMTYPLPSEAAALSSGVVTAAKGRAALRTDANARLAARVADIAKAIGRSDVKIALAPAAPSSSGAAAAWNGLAALAQLTPAERRRGTAVSVQLNTVEQLRLAGEVGPALMLFLPLRAAATDVATVTGNLMTANSTLVAAIIGADVAEITGNSFLALGARQLGLVAQGARGAVSGNVIRQTVLIAVPRALPAPFDVWGPFNDIGA